MTIICSDIGYGISIHIHNRDGKAYVQIPAGTFPGMDMTVKMRHVQVSARIFLPRWLRQELWWDICSVIGYDISNHDHDNRDDEMCSDLSHFLSFPTYYVSSHRNVIWRYACSKGKATMIKMQIQTNLVTMRCTFFGQEVLGLIFWIKKIKSSW